MYDFIVMYDFFQESLVISLYESSESREVIVTFKYIIMVENETKFLNYLMLKWNQSKL